MASPTPFMDLLDDPKEFRKLVLAFAHILRGSFITDERRRGKEYRQRIHTQAEEKRRADILGRWFRVMRGDLGFSMQLTMDQLPRALRAELDGETYEPPDKNRLWTPGGVVQ